MNNIILVAIVYAIMGDITYYYDYYLDQIYINYPADHEKHNVFERMLLSVMWPIALSCMIFWVLRQHNNFKAPIPSISKFIYNQIDKIIEKQKTKHIVNLNVITKFKVK